MPGKDGQQHVEDIAQQENNENDDVIAKPNLRNNTKNKPNFKNVIKTSHRRNNITGDQSMSRDVNQSAVREVNLSAVREVNQSASRDVTKALDYRIDVVKVTDLLSVKQLSQQIMADRDNYSELEENTSFTSESFVQLSNSNNLSDGDRIRCDDQKDVDDDGQSIGSVVLEQEIKTLRSELASSRLMIKNMQEREKQLRDRLSEQAQRQLEQRTTKFENVALGDNRPTQLIKRYGNLYSEGRLEALDALDDLEEMNDCDDLKTKLLLSVIVLAFRSAQHSLYETRASVGDLLHIPLVLESTNTQHVLVAQDLEETISVYLKKTVDRHDLSKNYDEVCERVWATLFDYPSLRDCAGLLHYIEDCVRLAWALTLQNPPLVIDYESKTFDEGLHVRFHASNADCDVIRTVLWPMLTEGENGPCVHRGVVLT